MKRGAVAPRRSRVFVLFLLLSVPAAAGIRPKTEPAPAASPTAQRRYKIGDLPDKNGRIEPKTPTWALIVTLGLAYFLPGSALRYSSQGTSVQIQTPATR